MTVLTVLYPKLMLLMYSSNKDQDEHKLYGNTEGGAGRGLSSNDISYPTAMCYMIRHISVSNTDGPCVALFL